LLEPERMRSGDAVRLFVPLPEEEGHTPT